MIDEKGDNLGELDTHEAIQIAQDRGLDLVEVSPNANPPVCRIVSWSKFQYQQQKKLKDNKSKAKRLKEMWFSSSIGEKDLERKTNRAKEFLTEGHPVKITMKGGKRVSSDAMKLAFDKVLTYFEDYSKITDVQKGFRQMSVTFKQKKNVQNSKNIDEKTETVKPEGEQEAKG